MVKFVDIETPYSAKDEKELRKNLLYARACVRDSLMRGEIPFASHLFYTQPEFWMIIYQKKEVWELKLVKF